MADPPGMNFSKIDEIDRKNELRSMVGPDGTTLPIAQLYISAAEAQKLARDRSTQIFRDWNLLKKILDRHESTIRKRWANKTKAQREDVLLYAWPKMAATHRPDFAAFRTDWRRKTTSNTKFKESYMWPYVNLEDLSTPKALPLFLSTRAQNAPHVFALADESAVSLGYSTRAIVAKLLKRHKIMITNQKSVDDYGKLMAYGTFESFLSGPGALQPGRGLVILEIQERVMRFLVDCCKRIMRDIPDENELLSDKYPIQPPRSLPRDTVQGFSSRALMAAEAPYRLPQSLDLESLQTLLSATVSAAEDHIMALREDPAYFADTLLTNKEHRTEMIKDTRGQEHPVLRLRREHILWRRVIGNVINDAYFELEMWAELLNQVRNLRRLQMGSRASISIDKDLPDEYLTALLKFHYYLETASKGTLCQLSYRAMPSPPLRSLFVRVQPENSTTDKMLVDKKSDDDPDKIVAELIWQLKTLWEDGEDLASIGLPVMMDEFEWLIQSEAKAKALISPHISAIIGKLAVTAEGLRQLMLYKPWSQDFASKLAEKKKDLDLEYTHKAEPWVLVYEAVYGSNSTKIIQLGDPSKSRFYYPVEKRRTKENVEAMRTAEQNLDAFWLLVDESLEDIAGENLDRLALRKLLAQPRVLERTPEWTEPVKNKRDVQPTAGIDVIRRPFSELYFDLEHRTEQTVDHSRNTKTSSTKAKTRSVPAPALNSDGVAALPPSISPDRQDRQPTIFVNARALKVFRTLFHTPSITGTPGEVAWVDFLHAMVSTGFAPEKLFGSVWQFQPASLDVDRSIHFHEPHPSGKLPYRTARRFGRRLERAYGWVGSTFQLAEKRN